MEHKKQTIICIVIICLLLFGCVQNQYFPTNENTEMWIAICDNNDIYYQTSFENEKNTCFKISNNSVEPIETGYIFSMYANGNDIYYAEHYMEADTEIKYIPYGSTTPQVLFSVDRESISRTYREYLYINNNSLFYNTIHGTLYEYKISEHKLNKRLEDTNCSIIIGDEVFYSDTSGNIYKNNLNFDEETEILSVNDVFNAGIRKELKADNSETIKGSIVRLSAYKNKLYFTFSRIYKDSPGMMFTCNMDGSNIKLLMVNNDANILIDQFQCYDDKIYFLGYTENDSWDIDDDKLSLYHMNLNGKDVKLINDVGNLLSFYVHDDCVYYKPVTDSNTTFKAELNTYNLKTGKKSEIALK